MCVCVCVCLCVSLSVPSNLPGGKLRFWWPSTAAFFGPGFRLKVLPSPWNCFQDGGWGLKTEAPRVSSHRQKETRQSIGLAPRMLKTTRPGCSSPRCGPTCGSSCTFRTNRRSHTMLRGPKWARAWALHGPTGPRAWPLQQPKPN